jgi:hypothetical protein
MELGTAPHLGIGVVFSLPFMLSIHLGCFYPELCQSNSHLPDTDLPRWVNLTGSLYSLSCFNGLQSPLLTISPCGEISTAGGAHRSDVGFDPGLYFVQPF